MSSVETVGTSQSAVPAASKLRMPSVLSCGLTIVLIKASLKILGFAGTLDWIRRRVQTIPQTVLADIDDLRVADHSVALAGALYPGRARCLEQSLTLYYVLRCRGVPVRYCHGVQPYPFQAHAWIEYGDVILSDVPEHARQFSRLPDQLP